MKFFPHFLIFTSIFLLSCVGNETQEQLVIPSGAQAGSLDLKPGNYKVDKKEYSATIGNIFVKENRSKQDSRLIALPLIKVHATGDSIAEPIFYLTGGPGIPNVKSYLFVNDFVETHDIVLVGYRGAEGSVVLNCPEIDEFFSDPPGDITEEVTIDSMANAYSRCAKRLRNQGVDTDGYNITEVIHDVEEARLALGYDRINLLSGSYGTRLAMIYAWMFPNSVHRSAMISVNPPGHFVWFPDVLDDQIRYYSELCSKDPECSSKTENLAETIRKAVQNMPDRWLFFPIKKGNALIGTFMMLYHTSTSPQIFDAWIAAGKGDWSGIALLSISIDFMMKGASIWGESASKAMSADYIFDPHSNPLEEFMPPNSIIGAPGSIPGIAGAKGWPANIIADSLRRVQYSDVPTLLISGNIDVSTPARFARDELLPFLTNGQQVILSEFGHTGDIWTKQRDALVYMLEKYYTTGIVDDSHFEYAPMDFKVGLGFPTIMKLILAGTILILLILILVVWFVVRKIRKRPKEME